MKYSYLTILFTTLISCNSQTIDLSTIDFNKTKNTYLENIKSSRITEQKDSWKLFYLKNGEFDDTKLVDDGKKSKIYYFSNSDELAQFNYNNIQLDSFGAKIAEYEDKIAFINCHLEKSKTFEVIEKLRRNLGEPIEIVSDTIGYVNNSKEINFLSKNLLKSDYKTFQEESFGKQFICPRSYIWIKDNIIYEYTLIRSGDASCANNLTIISKKIFKDKIILGYHNPEEAPILSKYLNL